MNCSYHSPNFPVKVLGFWWNDFTKDMKFWIWCITLKYIPYLLIYVVLLIDVYMIGRGTAIDCPSQLTLELRPLLLGTYSCIYPSSDSRRLYILPLHVRERTSYNPYPCLMFNFLSTPSISLWNYVLFNKRYYPKLAVRPVHICRSHFESVQFVL